MNHPSESSNLNTEINCNSHNAVKPKQSESLSQFERIEASFEVIAAEHRLPHRRLLALTQAARFHGVPSGTFKKAFELWLETAQAQGGEQ